jgi:hypothetical protein
MKNNENEKFKPSDKIKYIYTNGVITFTGCCSVRSIAVKWRSGKRLVFHASGALKI